MDRVAAMVLVVEDEAALSNVVQAYLAKAGYETASARSGPEAVEMARTLSPDVIVLDLGLPDGDIAFHEQRLTDLLIEILLTKPPGTWCAATWRGDGHPDHEAVGRAAATATAYTGTTFIEYPVWMWHWAQPDDIAVPWDRTFAAPSTPAAVERKKLAAQCFESQFVPQSPERQPVLPAYLLPRLLSVGEVVFC